MHSERPALAASLARPSSAWQRSVGHADRLLAIVTEVPAAALVLAEVLVLLSGVSAVMCSTARWDGPTNSLDALPLARDAGCRHCASTFVAHAHDGAPRHRLARNPGLPRSVRSGRLRRIPAAGSKCHRALGNTPEASRLRAVTTGKSTTGDFARHRLGANGEIATISAPRRSGVLTAPLLF